MEEINEIEVLQFKINEIEEKILNLKKYNVHDKKIEALEIKKNQLIEMLNDFLNKNK